MKQKVNLKPVLPITTLGRLLSNDFCVRGELSVCLMRLNALSRQYGDNNTCRHLMTVYDVTMRTVIDVPDEVIEALDRLSSSKQRSRASFIREALARYVEQSALPNAQAAFGIWSKTNKDGVDYQTDIRREWGS
ncbi:MAG: ribbon-helix-helix domain-containing protein [Akkermansiaceae bacterium]|nr:ribbon-helix-helix domain-containing protein [Akkermansiaceae bacterium]